MLKIVKDIELPERKGRIGEYMRKYPFNEMKVGDGVIADKKAAGAARNYSKSHGVKFVSRTAPDGSVVIKRIA